MHVKEPMDTYREREGACPSVSGFAPCAPSRVDICARYKSSVLLLLLPKQYTFYFCFPLLPPIPLPIPNLLIDSLPWQELVIVIIVNKSQVAGSSPALVNFSLFIQIYLKSVPSQFPLWFIT